MFIDPMLRSINFSINFFTNDSKYFLRFKKKEKDFLRNLNIIELLKTNRIKKNKKLFAASSENVYKIIYSNTNVDTKVINIFSLAFNKNNKIAWNLINNAKAVINYFFINF